MLVLTESEIKKCQREMVNLCQTEIFSHLDTAQELFGTFFPKATISVVGGDEAARYSAPEVVKSKLQEIETWIREVFDTALTVYQEDESENISPDPITLPEDIGKRIMSALLEILTCGRDFRDNDLYFISDVTIALSLDANYVLKSIEQVQYEIRRSFFDSLLDYLTEDQCLQSAILLYKAIQADDQLHPAEFKYIENINQLLKNDQSKIELVEHAVQSELIEDSLEISEELASHLFKYLIEIVLCDQDFDPQESLYVNDVAQILGFDGDKRDEILQPIAATLMVRDSLFPKLDE
jgi:uncharacterized tellurite resistance protein B-like protein